MPDGRPIGIFDSSVGGLTVARAIAEQLPNESLLYVGDGARFPYGPRPVEEIRGFAMEVAGWLVERDVKMLVVACNSVEVSAIGDIASAHDVPVIGVVNPGASGRDRGARATASSGSSARWPRSRRGPTNGRLVPRSNFTRRPARSSWSTSSGGTRRATRCEGPRAGILHR